MQTTPAPAPGEPRAAVGIAPNTGVASGAAVVDLGKVSTYLWAPVRRFPIAVFRAPALRVRRRLMVLGALLAGAVLCGGLRAGEGASDAPPGEPADPVEVLVRRGNAARQNGQIAAALEAYRAAERLAPQRYEVRLVIADTLRRTGRPDQASVEYDAAVGIDPRRHEGYAGQAIVRRAAYDYDGAAAILQAALGRVADAHRPDLLLTLAETRRRQGRLAEAESLFRQVLEARPGEAPIYAGLAQVAEARGEIGAAVADWDLYLKGKPDDDGAALRRQELLEVEASIEALRAMASHSRGAAIPAEIGRLLSIAGDARGAASSFREALGIDPENEEARRGLALALRDAGDGPGASAQFRRLLRARPRDAVALYNLVGLARAAGDLKAEESAWRALLDALPGDLVAARSFVGFAERASDGALEREIVRETGAAGTRKTPAVGRRLAFLLAAAGRWDEAAGALYDVLRGDPSDPWTEEVVNEILQARPTFLQALIDLERSEQPGDGGASGGAETAPRLLVRARLTWWAGRAGDALILMRQAAAADARSPIASAVLAEGYQTIARDGAMALQELRRAVALDPDRLAGQIDLALALLRAGRPGEAEQAARAALKVDPDSPPALSALGAALMDEGDMEGAARAYAAALRSDPADNFGLARGQYPGVLAALGRQVEARHALKGEIPPIPEALYHEAWIFARDSYRDRTYNGQDWQGFRDRYRGRLRTVEDAYRAIAEMLASLGDPYTRLRDPEETATVFLARHAAPPSSDALGRNRPESATVEARDLSRTLGYIRLSNLTDPGVVAGIRKALEEMRRKEGIVLDLRGNAGGYSRSADAIGDLLVGPGKEAGTDIGPDGPESRVTGGDGALIDGKIVVLVDGQTASAAERLARTLDASGRAEIVGDQTRGKGMAQKSRVLPGGATVLVSAVEMLGPDGQPIQGRGLRPRTRAEPPREP